MLTSYSHTPQLADLRRCVHARRSDVVPGALPAPRRPWSLPDRLDDRTRKDMINDYRAGATAASLATTHGLSLRSVKRLLATAEVRRTRGQRDGSSCASRAIDDLTGSPASQSLRVHE